jgi:excisionase family DNA binding protein
LPKDTPHQPVPGRDDRAVARLLIAEEVAELLAVPESWVREATREGRIPYVALGRYRRYEQDAILAFLAEHRAGPQPTSLPSLAFPAKQSL